MGEEKDGKLRRMVKSFVRFMGKLRDSYMQGMTECSGKFEYGATMACPTVPTVPRSYSVSSTKSNYENDDFRELVRAASSRKQSPMPNHMPRSQSVAIGRIDEDSPCEFHGDVIKLKADLFPRSKSHAPSSKRIIVAL